MKAFKTDDGRVILFRPIENFKRLNRSGFMLGLPVDLNFNRDINFLSNSIQKNYYSVP